MLHFGLSEAGAGHHPPRPRRPAGHRPADRVLAVDPRRGGRDPAAAARARHRLRPVLAARPRPAHRADPHRRRLRRRRLAQDQPAVHRRELPPQPRHRRRGHGPSAPRSAPPRRRPRSPGSSPAATTSPRSPAPAASPASRRTPPPTASSSPPTSSTGSTHLAARRRRTPRRSQHGLDRPLILTETRSPRSRSTTRCANRTSF